ncbi:MAG TPA: type I-U CRISPR-associated protein Csx17, partial [Planctomycetaceae bacterium]|nr:type I-U CRISPR-associated protein Csx17 [Planctomycetaceae bacterium]
MTHEVELAGCTPEPLMNYLKALGVFRLVAEQADPDATACWRADRFVLRSRFDQGGLVEFLLHDYQPTPIVAPWAGGSGFFGKDNRSAVEAIAQSKTPRLEPYRDIIRRVQEILAEEGLSEKPNAEQKERLLRRYRREMPDCFIQWMDTAIILQAEGQVFAPVLGTGGNDGRLDFTQNVMQRLADQLHFVADSGVSNTRPLLLNSLVAEPVSGLAKAAVGQFAPGRAGGPNATQGMEGDSTDNPWDFVLMLEGTLLLAGALVRRTGILSTDKAAFPFTVRARPVGAAAGTDSESTEARGELWLPLWKTFVSRRELELLFAEGRAELAARPARDAVDFARAVASLGVDRGIRQFARFGFLKRSGKAFLAVAMERFPVPDRPREAVGLIQEVDRWLDGFRRIAGPDASARFRMALSQIESAVFDYCRYGRREDILNVLIALATAQEELAVTGGKRGNKVLCPPLGTLSPKWLTATHDGSLEYEIALALAGIYDRERKLPPIRANVEPVELKGNWWNWCIEIGPEVVWKRASLTGNMIAALERRIMDGLRNGCETLPLDCKRSLPLEAIALFLAGEPDDERVERLFRALLLIDHRAPLPERLPRPKWPDPPP